MCGVTLSWDRTGQPPDMERFRQSMRTLHRRGPDGSGIWHEAGFAMGHRRLAVLDVSTRGAQPMMSQSGRCVIAHNGEVYNFQEIRAALGWSRDRWRSTSDTEVIVEAYERWGVDCLTRLQGMFAFAIYDRYARTLFVVRDRLGIKPLFYAIDGSQVLVASRPRALLALEPRLSSHLSPNALRYFIECGYVPAPLSIYESIRKLPPAHYLLVTERGETLQRYWKLPAGPSVDDRRTEAHCLEELDALTDDAVRCRMISDVPVGAFLSGGLDSALIVAKMRKFSSQTVQAYTLGFGKGGYDETATARLIARYLGVAHTVEQHDPAALLELMDLYFEEFDEPLYDSSALAAMAVSRLARKAVTVALTGDGGDELFGGYTYYRWLSRLSPLWRLPKSLRQTAAAAIRCGGSHRAVLLSNAVHQPSEVDAFAFMRSVAKDFQSLFEWRQIGADKGFAALVRQLASEVDSYGDEIAWATHVDLNSVLPDDYLPKLDLASMAFSLEAREPLLDYRLVEWSRRLPSHWKVRSGVTKYI